METLFLLIPLLLILVTLAYGVAQVLIRAWLDYRVRIAFLEKLEKNPALLGPQADVTAVMSNLTTTSIPYQRQNYSVTGLVLSAIGVACFVGGRLMRSGELAVGIYLGGVFCVVLGLVIALFGLIIRLMSRPSARPG
ncbi:MAG: hypothetical protein HUU46_15580 [Candidatus Hydrogenedentes bacterium]|nr:hypothetical protein [Candidatus Hydrogenedentota bacterium]